MSKITFRIVENAYDEVDFEQLKEDYLNPNMSVDDICEKHSISRKNFYRMKPKLVEETGVYHKPRTRENSPFLNNVAKYIYKDPLNNNYRISKTVNGVKRNFGSYPTLEEAEEMKSELISRDWDVEWFQENHKKEPVIKDTMYEEFKKDYLDGMKVSDLMKKYNLSRYGFYNLSTIIKQEMGLTRKPQKVKT